MTTCSGTDLTFGFLYIRVSNVYQNVQLNTSEILCNFKRYSQILEISFHTSVRLLVEKVAFDTMILDISTPHIFNFLVIEKSQ